MLNEITKEMISGLDTVNRERFDYIKNSIEQDGLVSPIVLCHFSDIAFSLSKKSIKDNVAFPIATPLNEAFTALIKSSRVSIDTKKKMNRLIGDTQLDFLFASGQHDISSLRLAPYLMSKQH